MRIGIILLPLLLVATTSAEFSESSSNSGKKQRIVCYYTNWSSHKKGLAKFLPEDIESSMCTHILYSFAVVKNGMCVTSDEEVDIKQGNYRKVIKAAKDKNSKVKVLLAVGGWNNGGKPFSDMALSKESRKIFIDSVTELLTEYEFDGFDLDWEYPVVRDGRPKDKDNFLKLIKELQAEFTRIAKEAGREKMELSAAVKPVAKDADLAYDRRDICKELDFVNMMQYDLHGSWETETGLAGALHMHPSDPNPDYSIADTVKTWLESGCEADKLVVGMPFYGRGWSLKSSDDTSVGASCTGPSKAGEFTNAAGMLAYYEICQKIENRGWKEHFLNEEGAVYAHGENEWFSYDNQESITMKAKYVKENGLGGAMVWALDFDDFTGSFCGQGRYPLLTAINKALNGQVRVTDDTESTGAPGSENCQVSCPKKSGHFKHLCDSRKYLNCDFGKPTVMMCPPILNFNQKKGVCDWPDAEQKY